MSGAKRIRRGRGRPKGTTNLQQSYWLAILDVVDEVRHKRGLGVSDACRIICSKRNGGLKWLDSYCQTRTHCGTFTKIDNPQMIRNRYYKALRFARAHNIPSDRPCVPRQQLLVFRYTGDRDREGRLRKKLVRHARFVFMPYPEK